MNVAEIVVLNQIFEEMESSSSESDDEDDLQVLTHLIEGVCDTESHAKIRGFIEDVVSQYSDVDVSVFCFKSCLT